MLSLSGGRCVCWVQYIVFFSLLSMKTPGFAWWCGRSFMMVCTCYVHVMWLRPPVTVIHSFEGQDNRQDTQYVMTHAAHARHAWERMKRGTRDIRWSRMHARRDWRGTVWHDVACMSRWIRDSAAHQVFVKLSFPVLNVYTCDWSDTSKLPA